MTILVLDTLLACAHDMPDTAGAATDPAESTDTAGADDTAARFGQAPEPAIEVRPRLSAGDDLGGVEVIDEPAVLTPGRPRPALGNTCHLRTGMTWAWRDREPALHADLVGCEPGVCDPYEGDTVCTESLPVLCIKQTGAPNPGVPDGFYDGWADGGVRLSEPVVGCRLDSVDAATDVCRRAFGYGWRMAEFHDGGGGWNWWAHGKIDQVTRAWAHIDDQSANCWNSL